MSTDSALIRRWQWTIVRCSAWASPGPCLVRPEMNIIAEASNGRESIQEFRALRPDVTLMDLPMPEMNGLDAIIAIRGEFHGTHEKLC